MEPKFNIDRPKIGDEEIKKHQNFEELVKQFKKQSLKQAKGDESWRKNKKVRYSAIIAGVTVICTVTLFALYNSQKSKKTNETLTTTSTPHKTSDPKGSTADQTTNSTTRFIGPPSSKMKIGAKGYTVNNNKGGVIHHASSTKIKVPANSFADKSGKDVIGDVTIEYREFHDAGDIILSGIPMAYDSAGHKFNLETAGMFEIKGSQNGEPVFIKPDKKLEVELASRNPENRFNQYYLDTVARNWTYIKRDQARPVEKTTNKAKEKITTRHFDAKGVTVIPLEQVNTPALLALDKEIKTILPKRIDSVKVIYAKKIYQLPKPKAPVQPRKSSGRPVFHIDGSDEEFPELAAFKKVAFEVGPENTNYRKQMHEMDWSDVSISEGPVKGTNYWITLTYRNIVEKMVVYPVLSGNDYTEAQEKYNDLFDEYKQLQSRKAEDEKRLMAEMQNKQKLYTDALKKKQEEYEKEKERILASAKQQQEIELTANFSNMNEQTKATRLFNISRFGIYNSDCPHPSPEGSSVTPMFVTNTGGKGFILPDNVYLVDHTIKTVYSITARDGLRFNYQPQNDYSVCAFSQGKIYICTKESFSSTIKAGSNKFSVAPMTGDPNDLIDFKKNLEL